MSRGNNKLNVTVKNMLQSDLKPQCIKLTMFGDADNYLSHSLQLDRDVTVT